MRNRVLILFPLMLAYLLMLSHDVIPHHHHETLVDAEHHHAIEHADHHHQDGTTGAHDHTMHFVHAPDFGSYLLTENTSIDNTIITLWSSFTMNFENLFSSDQSDESPIQWYEDNPPPLLNQYNSSVDFRGPPERYSFA